MSLSTLRKMTDEMDALSVEPTMIQGTRIAWPGGPAMAQNFSLPSSIIYYIAMNPENPEVYNKLIQSCKYFFERNPILVAAYMTETGICSDDRCYASGEGYGQCCVETNINKVTSKIWITRRLSLYNDTIPNFVALLRPKIYRCDNVKLVVPVESVELDDFKLFASSAKVIDLVGTKIVDNNGKPIMLENILEELPNVENFFFDLRNNASMISASAVKNISKLKNLGSFKSFVLFNVPEDFQLNGLFAFFKDHSGVDFHLKFSDNISEYYKIQLDQLTDSLIDSELSNCYIRYPGQDQEKRQILWKRFFE